MILTPLRRVAVAAGVATFAVLAWGVRKLASRS
jgi:hypothetical protein